jgi:UDP-N-acetyl-D-glucosamine dehydrogenase
VPVDPFYLAWKAREKGAATEFIELADRVNGRRPAYVVRGVGRLLNARRRSLNGAHVALLGVAYKKNVSDVRESPAVPVVELLEREGAVVTYHDPHVPALALPGRALRSQPLTRDYLAEQDCVVIVTDHDAIDWRLVRRCSRDVLDTRNVLRRQREPLGLTAYVAEAEGCG